MSRTFGRPVHVGMGVWLTTSSHILSDIASRAYERAPQPLVAAYQYTAPLRQILKDWRVPVKLSHGLTKDGRPASLLVAGAGPSIHYMLGRFFALPPHDETVGHVQLTDLMRTLRRLRTSADMTIAQLEPFQQRYREITGEAGYLACVLREGAERVAPIANDTVRTVKERMGLYVG